MGPWAVLRSMARPRPAGRRSYGLLGAGVWLIGVLWVLAGCVDDSLAADADGLWMLKEAMIAGEPVGAPDGLRTVVEVDDGDLTGWSAPCVSMHGELREQDGRWVPTLETSALAVGCIGRDWEDRFTGALGRTSLAMSDDEMRFEGESAMFRFERLDPIDPGVFDREWRLLSWSLPDVPDRVDLDDFTATVQLHRDGTIELDTGCGRRTGTWEPRADTVSVPFLEPSATPCPIDLAPELITLAGHVGNIGMGFRPQLAADDRLHLIPGPPGLDSVVFEMTPPT